MRQSKRRVRQRGAVLVMALVCLLVIASLGAFVLRSSLQEFQRSRVRERQLQTLWLVESGVDRAIASLAASPEYSGETWQLTPEDLDDGDAATVRIDVESDEQDPQLARITVEATYSNQPQRRIKLRRMIEIEPPQTGEES